jgi:hypothetical protein
MEQENRFQIILLELLTILLFSTYIAYLVGIVQDHPIRLLYINQVIKIICAIYLLYRFNKYRKISLTELDKVVVCSIGLYVFLVSFSEFFEKISDYARSYIIMYEFLLLRYFQSIYA